MCDIGLVLIFAPNFGGPKVRYSVECILKPPAKIVRGEKFGVKFSTCPLNAPVRGMSGGYSRTFYMFNFQHPRQCGEHPHQEMASYGPEQRASEQRLSE